MTPKACGCTVCAPPAAIGATKGDPTVEPEARFAPRSTVRAVGVLLAALFMALVALGPSFDSFAASSFALEEREPAAGSTPLDGGEKDRRDSGGDDALDPGDVVVARLSAARSSGRRPRARIACDVVRSRPARGPPTR